GPASSDGQAGKPQSHPPVGWGRQRLAVMVVPSEHLAARVDRASPAQSFGVQEVAASPPRSGGGGGTGASHPRPFAPTRNGSTSRVGIVQAMFVRRREGVVVGVMTG